MADFVEHLRAKASNGPEPAASAGSGSGLDNAGNADPRREALIASLRQRYLLAQARGDAAAKQALFREAVYLNLPPELWQEPPGG